MKKKKYNNVIRIRIVLKSYEKIFLIKIFDCDKSAIKVILIDKRMDQRQRRELIVGISTNQFRDQGIEQNGGEFNEDGGGICQGVQGGRGFRAQVHGGIHQGFNRENHTEVHGRGTHYQGRGRGNHFQANGRGFQPEVHGRGNHHQGRGNQGGGRGNQGRGNHLQAHGRGNHYQGRGNHFQGGRGNHQQVHEWNHQQVHGRDYAEVQGGLHYGRGEEIPVNGGGDIVDGMRLMEDRTEMMVTEFPFDGEDEQNFDLIEKAIDFVNGYQTEDQHLEYLHMLDVHDDAEEVLDFHDMWFPEHRKCLCCAGYRLRRNLRCVAGNSEMCNCV